MAKKKCKKKQAKKRYEKKPGPVKKRAKKVIKGEVKVRDKSPDAEKILNRRGREVLLDDEMLAKTILLWRYGVNNERISRILGIGWTTFKRWVRENRPVEVIIIPNQDSKLSRRSVVGFKELMEHEKDNLKASYLQRLEELIEEAREEGDLKTASKNLTWLMEKMLPHVFGDPRYRPEGDPNKPKRVGFPLRPPTFD